MNIKDTPMAHTQRWTSCIVKNILYLC